MPLPIPVAGKTVAEAEKLIRRYYTGKEPGSIEVLKPGHDRLLVTLQRQHVTRVLVIRQDTGGSRLAARYSSWQHSHRQPARDRCLWEQPDRRLRG